ncbi:hypothetical protein [Bombilactobacillus thymidiniphilus]|uniref:Alpha/beta hydrolase n=1 Tax=Bombilactobacillus thymidiniphilus TaxID=2923363 RepID=A0ABY4PBY6_9LACO|nr:hypothetical protein [Bombilactobacillus thymidiniphilus]UQS83201.1 hypothetical protein MOO47_05285 [Bombilactobacillus thymidiniphilus]
MIQVQDVTVSNGKLVYYFEDNQQTKNTIFLPDMTQSVNSCLQIMIYNGLTNSYALDFRYHGLSSAQGAYDLNSLASDLTEFIQKIALTNYQIVAAGNAVWVVEQAILQYQIQPQKVVALDSDFITDNTSILDADFADYSTLLATKKQAINQQAATLDLQEYQQQMILNAQMADYHKVEQAYQLYVTTTKQQEFNASLPRRSFSSLAMPTTLLLTKASQQKIVTQKLTPTQRKSYAAFECYVIDKTPHELLWYAPLTVLNFI